DDCEILVQVRRQEDGKIEASVFDRKSRILKAASLLLQLNLSLDRVAVCRLSRAFRLLGTLEKPLRLLDSLLRCDVTALSSNQRVIVLRHSDVQTSACNVHSGTRESLCGSSPFVIRIQNRTRRQFLMDSREGSIDMDTIGPDEASIWRNSISLCPDVLAGSAQCRQPGRLCLPPV